MVRRGRFYPGQFDRTRWDAAQSDVPSQDMPVPLPYDPQYQQDIRQNAQQAAALEDQSASGTDGSIPSGAQAPGAQCSAPSNNSFVEYSFESRPPLALDIVGPLLNSATASQDNFTVPIGYICIVKQIVYGGTPVGGSAVDLFGNPVNTHSLLVTINGNPVPNYNNVDVSNGAIAGFEMECFIIARASDVIRAQVLRGFPGVSTGSAVPGGVQFYGTLLSDDGRDPSLQVGAKDAEPVALCASDIAAIRPNPMVLPTSTGPIVVTSPPKAGQINCPKPPAVSVNDYLACVNAQGAAINNP